MSKASDRCCKALLLVAAAIGFAALQAAASQYNGVTVTPETFSNALANAESGDVIYADEGTYSRGIIPIPRRPGDSVANPDLSYRMLVLRLV